MKKNFANIVVQNLTQHKKADRYGKSDQQVDEAHQRAREAE